MIYANTMGSFAPTSVLDEDDADDVCAKTYNKTLEGRDAWGEAVVVEVEWRPLRLEPGGRSQVNGVEVVYTEDEPPVVLRSTGYGNLELAYRPYSIPQGASYAGEVDNKEGSELGPGKYRVLSEANLAC
jgi:hypothetical protein